MLLYRPPGTSTSTSYCSPGACLGCCCVCHCCRCCCCWTEQRQQTRGLLGCHCTEGCAHPWDTLAQKCMHGSAQRPPHTPIHVSQFHISSQFHICSYVEHTWQQRSSLMASLISITWSHQTHTHTQCRCKGVEQEGNPCMSSKDCMQQQKHTQTMYIPAVVNSPCRALLLINLQKE